MSGLEIPLLSAWKRLALCAQTDPEAFFPEKGSSNAAAKRVCMACEVRVECLEWALDQGEPHGVWGGMSERERRRLARELPRRCTRCRQVLPDDCTARQCPDCHQDTRREQQHASYQRRRAS